MRYFYKRWFEIYFRGIIIFLSSYRFALNYGIDLAAGSSYSLGVDMGVSEWIKSNSE